MAYVISLLLKIITIMVASFSLVVTILTITAMIKEKAIFRNKKEIVNIPKPPSMRYDDIMDIINTTINERMERRKKLIYDLNDMVMYDFDKELKTLSEEVYNSLSKSLINEFIYYQTEEYLKKYIVDFCLVLLLNDLSKRKPKVGTINTNTIRA